MAFVAAKAVCAIAGHALGISRAVPALVDTDQVTACVTITGRSAFPRVGTFVIRIGAVQVLSTGALETLLVDFHFARTVDVTRAGFTKTIAIGVTTNVINAYA